MPFSCRKSCHKYEESTKMFRNLCLVTLPLSVRITQHGKKEVKKGINRPYPPKCSTHHSHVSGSCWLKLIIVLAPL